jgi:hypothetical protein
VTASNLHPIYPGNLMVKFADDSYLIVSAARVRSCAVKIAHVDNWATENNLKLSRIKSVEIALVSPWSKRAVKIPPPAVPGFERAESIKVLGVTISRRFSIIEHVDNLHVSCAQTLFAMRTLKHYGLEAGALHAVFQAIVFAKLSYASPAWWGMLMLMTSPDWRRSSAAHQS